VDAGNTKTVALITTTDGEIIGAGRSGCGDIYGAASPDEAMHAVNEAVSAALQQAAISNSQLLSGGFSMAGADWPEDTQWLVAQMTAMGLGKSIVVMNDAIGGLFAGSPDGCGISVILGTGPAIGVRNSNGEFWHGGFWIHNLSSRDLLGEVYSAVIQAELGNTPSTSLTERILEISNEQKVEQWLHKITMRGSKHKFETGVVISALMDEAVVGDNIAVQIVKRYANKCAEFALAGARKVNIGMDGKPIHLVLGGGMMRHPSGMLPNLITERIRVDLPSAIPIISSFEPVAGALFAGFAAAEIKATPAIKDNLRRSMPDHAFFSTK